MKEKRVKELLTAYQQDGDMKARDEVVLAHMHACEWWVGKYRLNNHRYMDMEDIKQLGYLALVEACDYYKTDRDDANFYSLAVAKIRQRLHNEVVASRKTKGRAAERSTQSLSTMWREDGDPMFTDGPQDTNCQYGWDSLDPQPMDANALLVDMAQRLRDLAPEVLSTNEYEIYKLRFEMGLSYEQIGRQFGVSRQHVGFVGKRAQRKLKSAFERELQLQEGE